MRTLDYSTHSVTQYCADACGCSNDPNLRVQRFDAGVTAANAAAAEAAAGAGTRSFAGGQGAGSCCVRGGGPNRNY